MGRPVSVPKSSRFLAMGSVCIVVAALYLASSVLIPLALGILLAFLLAPISNRLERLGVRRVLASLIVVVFALTVVALVGWLISAQVTNLAEQIPQYRTEIVERIHSVQRHFQGGSLAAASNTVAEVAHEVTTNPQGTGTPRSPMAVTVISAGPSPGILGTLSDALMVLAPLAQFVVVIVVATFMLVQRDDLRDRLLSLLGHGRLTETTQALDEAARRVSAYLVSQTLVNGSYAIVIGIALSLIGIPQAALWGLICGLLRFIPYAGVWAAAAFPILISCVLPDGSGAWFFKPLMTIGVFLGMELIVANVFEPLVYGARTGVSSVAIIIAAVFWTWLWGAAGLFLSTPLTVCLAVAGKHMPQLRFLHILLGDEPALAPHERFYQRLLADDIEQARDLVEGMATGHQWETIYDTVLIPALRMAERDAFHGALDETRLGDIQMAVQEIVEDRREQDLGRVEPQFPGGDLHVPRDVTITVLILPAQDRADEIAGLMLAHLLDRQGYSAVSVSSEMLASEMIESAGRLHADLVCISALPPGAPSHARYIAKRLRGKFPELGILIGLWSAHNDIEKARRRNARAPSVHFATTLAGALQSLHQMVPGLLIRGEAAERLPQ